MDFVLGKHIGRLGHQDPGEFPEEVKALFEKAVEYYEENMVLMVEIQVVYLCERWKFKLSICRTGQHKEEHVEIWAMYIIYLEILTKRSTTMKND